MYSPKLAPNGGAPDGNRVVSKVPINRDVEIMKNILAVNLNNSLTVLILRTILRTPLKTVKERVV